jgi:hypothetical protein
MKKLCALVLWLTVVALLCGCVASGASELPTPTEPANQPAARLPLNGEPMPQLPADNNQSLDVDPNSALTYSNFGSLSPIICIRTYDQLIKHFGNTISDTMPQFNPEFFKDHSLILVHTTQTTGPYHIEAGEVKQDSSGNYSFELKFYWPEATSPATHSESLIIIVDHIIANDAVIDYHSSHETVHDYNERFQ